MCIVARADYSIVETSTHDLCTHKKGYSLYNIPSDPFNVGYSLFPKLLTILTFLKIFLYII